MATMVKEKRKERKKKARDKDLSPTNLDPESELGPTLTESATNSMLKQLERADDNLRSLPDPTHILPQPEPNKNSIETDCDMSEVSPESSNTNDLTERYLTESLTSQIENITVTPKLDSKGNCEAEIIVTPESTTLTSYEYDTSIEASPKTTENTLNLTEELSPSAPVFETIEKTIEPTKQETVKVKSQKAPCMSLEEAIRLFGAKEIMAVTEMSEREEAFVEAGPSVGADHPLVDLLHTLRCSVSAVERERVNLARGYAEEEKFRNALWKVEKRQVTVSEKCKCGADVTVKASYEHAELMKDKIPAAKMRLQSLLTDVQESYCHHQHAALLAHCQIEDLIANTMSRGKPEIRTALSLILQELRLSESGSEAICGALRRWARALVAALLNKREPRQMLFLFHHLFRQSRSVQWAAKLLSGLVTAGDLSSACSAIALLDVALAGGKVASAQECTEEMEEVWEELDRRGDTAAVADGSLRERDLLALLRAFPARDIVARLALIRHQDITQAVEYEWGDASGGRGVLKSVCGARTLLAVLQRAANANAAYKRLTNELVMFGEQTAWAVADLHEHSRSSYSYEIRDVISRELEACFAAIFNLCVSGNVPLQRLPYRLLSDESCEALAAAVIASLHDNSTKSVEEIEIEIPPKLTCEARVRILTGMAVDRATDYELARKILEFLFQTGVKRKQSACKGGCETAARESISELLARHAHLYPAAFNLLVDSDQESIQSSVALLAPSNWRPSPHGAAPALQQCARAARLVPALLLALDWTPHSGLSLETQLAISAWLTEYQLATSPTTVPEWCWTVFRKMALHRAWWGLPGTAGPGGREPRGLFEEAVVMMATEISHSVPLICEYGIKTLERLVRGGRAREAAHCLGPVMLVMAQSPESITYTPKFNEVFSLMLESGPSLLQRAIGREVPSGLHLIHNLVVKQIRAACEHGSQQALFAAWLRALWPHPSARAALEAAAVCAGVPGALPSHMAALMQESDSIEILSQCVRHAAAAPALCWGGAAAAAAAAAAAGAGAGGAWPTLLDAMHARRQLGEQAHVDNTLKQIGWSISSEDLVIHKVAAALLAAPLSSPAHLLLWQLFFHLYLQRPPSDMRETTAPVGPLFFSGFMKSRTMALLRRRLQQAGALHRHEGTRLAAEAQTLDPRPTVQNPNQAKEKKPNYTSTSFLPSLTLGSSEGGSNSNSDLEGSDSSEGMENKGEDSPEMRLLGLRSRYHLNIAAPLIERFQSWLEEGEAVRATPNHESLLFQPDGDAIKAAWEAELQRITPLSSPLDEMLPPFPAPPRAAPPPAGPLQRVVERLKKYRSGKTRRCKVPVIKSPLEGSAAQDQRTLLRLLDRHLREVELLAKEWSGETKRAMELDAALWPLVGGLRVRRPAPPLRRACANKCKPITLVVPVEEWCISTRAERGIEENRNNSRSAISRLARPRPRAAKTAAALQSIIRQVRDTETACAVAERLRQSGGSEAIWSSVASALTDLCESYISPSAPHCAELLGAWRSASLQRAAAAGLVRPRRLPHWVPLYTRLLGKELAASEAFSCLSKFEPSLLSSLTDQNERSEALNAVTQAVIKHGPTPDPQYQVVLELLGVHTSALCSWQQLPTLLVASARAAARAALPPAHWPHVLAAVHSHAHQVPFDQLGHTLTELGAIWWEARGSPRAGPDPRHAAHAPPAAALLHALVEAFVDAALDLHYTTDQVAWYAWSACQAAWAPWARPQAGAPPLLPPGSQPALALLQKFLNQLRAIMERCPGSEAYIYQELFEWTGQIVLASRSALVTQEFKVQLATLLAEELKMDWSRPWFSARCMPTLMQVCSQADEASSAWACAVVRGARSSCWARGALPDQLAPHLAHVLGVLTALPFAEETLDEATKLPWWRLPAAGLQHAVEQFFARRYSAAVAYHDLPCFKLILFASELSVHPSINTFATRPGASEKRQSFISLYIRSLSHPSLQAHVAKGTRCLLDAITSLAPNVESLHGELENLLSRAITILCTEPAGAASLPVWTSWVSAAPARALAAALTALASLTTFDHYAVVADAAVKAYLLNDESCGWSEVISRWSVSAWVSAGPLAARGRLHAACGARLAAGRPRDVPPLHTAPIDFVESEVIVSAWICLLCRAGARAPLDAWAAAPRRSLLRTLTGQHSDLPTNKHRLLCRLAQCILTPDSEEAISAYESYLPTVLGSTPGEAADWGREAKQEYLPRLAMKLFPKEERYFRFESDLAK